LQVYIGVSGCSIKAYRRSSAKTGIFVSISTIPLIFWKIPGEKTLQLPYYDPSTGKYGQGLLDVYCVAAFAIALTVVWAVSVVWILEPIAMRMGLSKGKARRFAEQTWLGIYYSSMWVLGMVSCCSH
jgi:hypothetical protein